MISNLKWEFFLYIRRRETTKTSVTVDRNSHPRVKVQPLNQNLFRQKEPWQMCSGVLACIPPLDKQIKLCITRTQSPPIKCLQLDYKVQTYQLIRFIYYTSISADLTFFKSLSVFGTDYKRISKKYIFVSNKQNKPRPREQEKPPTLTTPQSNKETWNEM